MRIIENRGAQSGNASFVTDDQGHLTQEAQDESSDTDYKPMDFGLLGGGCETRMSYGNDPVGLNTSLNRKLQEQSQSLPSSSNASQKPDPTLFAGQRSKKRGRPSKVDIEAGMEANARGENTQPPPPPPHHENAAWQVQRRSQHPI